MRRNDLGLLRLLFSHSRRRRSVFAKGCFMPLLYYLRPDNYRQDLKLGFGFHLNQNSSTLLRAGPGDSLWAFARRGDGSYVLAAHLIVRGITHNVPGYRYGKYRIWGDRSTSRYFEVAHSPNAEAIIRSLSVTTLARYLGQSFQGGAAVRELTQADHRLLLRVAADLPTLEIASFYPEDELEARLVYGAPISAAEIAHDASERTRYLYERLQRSRSRELVRHVQELYQGKCQICLYNPRDTFRLDVCHAHHIIWVSRGGEDELRNMCLVCPNHHGAIHADDAVFDYAGLEFRFENGLTERIHLNSHLRPAKI